ncbi:MAG TPA: hypothetical protein VGW36_08245 [Pyrinomonadaceae bacterium]|nr:hypothetical protein [Pyrinomonadaceae bacterium]
MGKLSAMYEFEATAEVLLMSSSPGMAAIDRKQRDASVEAPES